MNLRSLFLAALALAPAALPAQHLSADGAAQSFNTLQHQYFEQVYFHYAPTAGTSAGLHQYDTQLEDWSAANLAKEIADLKAWKKKFEAIPANGLDATPAADRLILLGSIDNNLLQLEKIRGWETNADNYSSGATNAIFTIMERPYAPVNARLRSAVVRERLIPQLLEEGRRNLKNPPKIYTEIAIQQIDGDVSFFEHDVPSAFSAATDAAAKADFAKSNAQVITALKSYGAWLRSDLLPRSNGDFRWGKETFAAALADSEMVDVPLDHLLAVGLADLHKNQAEFARVAREIDPSKTPEQELAELAANHPAPDKLLSAFQQTFSSLQGFIRTLHIITLPSEERPVLEETPPFMRATTQASMDPPGPFEKGSTKAYFNVTLPDPAWDAAKTNEYMAAFNIGTVISTGVHEAFPGHYVQFLWMPEFPSDVRRVIGANTNIEGWAHYTEQMMLDEGYAAVATSNQRDQKLIRLGQLQDALLRDARFVVAIRMHTGVGGPMTIEQAEDFFVKEGYQSRPIAEVETKRGTSDALYLYYTLGKLEIMKLREDVKQKQGAAFSLQKFHDDLMRQGFAPIKVIRKAMLHDDSPVL